MVRIRRVLTAAIVALGGLLLLGCEDDQLPTAHNSATSPRAKNRNKNRNAPTKAPKAPPAVTEADPDQDDPAPDEPDDGEPADNEPDDLTDVSPDDVAVQPKPKPKKKVDNRVVPSPNASPFDFSGNAGGEAVKGEVLGGRRPAPTRPVELPKDTTMTPEQAVAAIKKSKGRVEKDENGYVVKVFLNRTKISDKGLRPVKYLPTIKVLNITGTGVTNAGLAYLKELTQLEHLYPDQTRISDEGIAGLKEDLPKLIVLE